MVVAATTTGAVPEVPGAVAPMDGEIATDLASVELQVRLTVDPAVTVVESAEMVTVGLGVFAVTVTALVTDPPGPVAVMV